MISRYQVTKLFCLKWSFATASSARGLSFCGSQADVAISVLRKASFNTVLPSLFLLFLAGSSLRSNTEPEDELEAALLLEVISTSFLNESCDSDVKDELLPASVDKPGTTRGTKLSVLQIIHFPFWVKRRSGPLTTHRNICGLRGVLVLLLHGRVEAASEPSCPTPVRQALPTCFACDQHCCHSRVLLCRVVVPTVPCSAILL